MFATIAMRTAWPVVGNEVMIFGKLLTNHKPVEGVGIQSFRV
jgi:hypothetical protein